MLSDQGWAAAPPDVSLDVNELHIWRAELDRGEEWVRRAELILAEDERERASRFRFARDRERFIVCRGFLRTILGRYLARPPHTLQFTYEAAGKPRLRLNAADVPLRFNVSHSGGLAVCGVTRAREIGIDVEAIRTGVGGTDIAEQYFSRAELSELRALPPGQRDEGFFLCWTRKEAYIKALGAGLGGIALDSFSVSLTPGAPATLVSEDSARWQLCSFSPGDGFAGAIVIEQNDSATRLLNYDDGTKVLSAL